MATATPAQIAAIQQLYVAYYNRPADAAGLDFWAGQVANGGSLAAISASFATNPEYKATYAGMSNDQVVATIYQNLFNRTPDAEGLQYWSAKLTAGALTVDTVVAEVAKSATQAGAGPDFTAVSSKVAAAIAFTDYLNSDVDARIAYSSGAVNSVGVNYVHSVIDAATLAAAQTGLPTVTDTALMTGYANVGAKTTLTANVDTVVGGVGNDIISGVVGAVTSGGVLVSAPTLSAADSIDGGAGINTLKVTDQAAGGGTTIGGFNLANIQNLSVTSVGAAIVDASLGLGSVKAINVVQSSGADVITAAGQSVAAVNSAGTVVINGSSTTQTVTTAGGVTLSGATGAINVTDTAQTSNSNVDGGTTVTYNNTTKAAVGSTLTIGNTAQPTGAVVVNETLAAAKGVSIAGGLITVNGGSTVTVNQTVTKTLADATAVGAANGVTTQSDVVVNGSAVTTAVTVNQVAATTAINSTTAIAGTTETATVKFGALAAGDTIILAGLTLTAPTGGLTAKQVAAAFANVSDAVSTDFISGAVSGKDSDTVVFSSIKPGVTPDLANTGTGAVTITKVEGVDEQDAGGRVGVVSGAVTIADTAAGTGKGTIATVTLSNYGNSTIDSDALATLNLSGKVGTLGLTNTGVQTLDLNLNKLSGTNTVTVAGAGQYTTVHVHTNTANSTLANFVDGVTTALTVDGTNDLTLTSAAGLTALKTITVSGAAGLAIGSALSTSVTDVNASATSGDVSVILDATKATFEGGSGDDSVTIGAAPTKAISGGTGNDSLVVNFAGGFNASGNTNISGFETLALGAAATTAYDATGFIHLTTGAIAAAASFTNVAAGTDLTITDDLGFGLTYTLKDATGTADALSLSLTSDGVGIDASTTGGVTAAGIESITIAANDVDPDAVAGATVDQLKLVAIAATKVVITGNTTLDLDLTGNTKVASVDASAMTGGLNYTTAGTIAETVKGGASANHLTAAAGSTADTLIGGASNDVLTANAGLNTLTGGAGNDTFVIGTASANVNSYATITDAGAGDVIQLKDLGTEVFSQTKVSLGGTAVFQDFANAAINAAGNSSANATVSWFQYGGDTYVVESLHNAVTTLNFTNGTDVIVKLTGIHDLSTASLLETGTGAPVLVLHS